jgi:hypothetical protein
MRVLPTPAPMLLRAWQRSGRDAGWSNHMVIASRYLPDPGDYLDLGRDQCLRVRHVAASVELGNDQLIVYGHLVARPPK